MRRGCQAIMARSRKPNRAAQLFTANGERLSAGRSELRKRLYARNDRRRSRHYLGEREIWTERNHRVGEHNDLRSHASAGA